MKFWDQIKSAKTLFSLASEANRAETKLRLYLRDYSIFTERAEQVYIVGEDYREFDKIASSYITKVNRLIYRCEVERISNSDTWVGKYADSLKKRVERVKHNVTNLRREVYQMPLGTPLSISQIDAINPDVMYVSA